MSEVNCQEPMRQYVINLSDISWINDQMLEIPKGKNKLRDDSIFIGVVWPHPSSLKNNDFGYIRFDGLFLNSKKKLNNYLSKICRN